MRRLVSVLLALTLAAVGAAWAEEEELHLLWGIEFGQDVETLQRILKEDFGVDMEYCTGENVFGEQREWLSCENIEEITILGYPLEEFNWYMNPTERVSIEFSHTYTNSIGDSVEDDEATAQLKDILRTLTEKFGTVDFATYEIYSAGFVEWLLNNRDNVREIGHFEDMDIEKLNIQFLMEIRDYITDSSDMSIYIYLDNIRVEIIWLNGSSGSHEYIIIVTFQDEVYEDTKGDVYEEFKYEYKGPVKYEDRGF